MALRQPDRIYETATVTGTGTVTLQASGAGAVLGYSSFSSTMANADTAYVCFADLVAGAWEVSLCTFTSGTNPTLARGTVVDGTNGTSLVSFAGNTTQIFIVVPGVNIETVAAAVATYAPLASPALTGTPTAPTATAGTNTTQLATTAFVAASFLTAATASATYAPLASPALTGTPVAPTATAGTNTTQLATTAFTTGAVATALPSASTSQLFGGTGTAGSAQIVALAGNIYRPGGSILTVYPTTIYVFATAGTGSQAIPTWATTVDIWVYAGGGSGANGTTAASGTATSGGAGGVSGNRVKVLGMALSGVTGPFTHTVGAGGAAPSGSGAQGNVGGQSYVNASGNFPGILANVGGTGTGGSTVASAGGGGGGFNGNGGNASAGTGGAGGSGFGATGTVGNSNNTALYAGLASPGMGSALGAALYSANPAVDGPTSGAQGGGVSSGGVGQAGGFVARPIASSGNATYVFNGGSAPGGNGLTPAAAGSVVIQPGMDSFGGGGGAGGNSTTAGGNGSAGSGYGAGGGGGGSTITGQSFGVGAAGNAGAVIYVFYP